MAAPMNTAAKQQTEVGDRRRPTVSANNDLFRVQFKRYKRRKPPPDLSEVIDFQEFDQASKFHPDVACQTCAATSCKKLGLIPVDKWQCFKLKSAPGFICIKNPFCPGYQRYWIKRCLQDYPNRPNISNLDGQPSTSSGLSLWDDSLTALGSPQDKKCLMDQLRWVTLGYHYDWTSKLYHQHNCTAFPGDLANLSAFVAAVLGCPTFSAQAGIVNFYHFDSTLGGHTDHSEFDLTVPIISFSLGQSAIFLLGGRTKETSPLAMYLHSGDIIIMGGQSRLAYHAVPKILTPGDTNTLPVCLGKVDISALGFDSETTSGQTQDCCISCFPEESESPMEPSRDRTCKLDLTISATSYSSYFETNSKESEKHTTPGSHHCESDSFINTGTDKVETDNSSGMWDGQNHDSTCRLKAISERLLTDLECTQIEEMTLMLQNDHTWEPFANYITRSRVNISVRQVTGHGCDFPADTMKGDHETSTNTISNHPSEHDEDLRNLEVKRKAECLECS